jgi:hypothetical protein
MKKSYASFLPILLIIALIGMLSSLTIAQVRITIRCNTSTCLDTLRSNRIVQMRGVTKKTTVPAMTWDTGINLTNVGGDYWERIIQALPGDTIFYKFVALFDVNTPTFHWAGWEGHFSAGVTGSENNRALIVGNKDTTLPLAYFNGWENTLAPYWRPFEKKTDTIAVYFRVNMGGVVFDPASQTVDVRGGTPMGTDNPWITIKTLTRETNSVNGGSFWSGVAYVPKASVTPGAQQQFKFVINNPDTWESINNRSFTFTTNLTNVSQDTTIAWVYFNNAPPRGPQVASTVNFRLRLDALEKAGLFNRGLGDKVAITGAKGWPPSGFTFETEPTMLKMTYVPSIQEWVLSEPFTLFPQTAIIYKYFIAFDTSRVSPGSNNYIPGLDLVNGWEEPGVTGGADRNYSFQAVSDQTVPGDFGADQQFFNSLPPNSVITTPIRLTFNIDMAPATNVTTNPTNPLFRPGIDTVFIQFDGCLISITQGLTMYGTDNRVRLSDLDGDGKYTGSIDLNPPTFYQVCYRLVYTSPTGEVSNGGGVQRGRRYYQYIAPTQVNADGSVVWPSSYTLGLMPWKASDLTVEDPPNLTVVTGVGRDASDVPRSYALYQNYPNPFNPSTVITYMVPENARVRIEIYNVLGQKVRSLLDQEQAPGTHSVVWNTESDQGPHVSSGMYLVKLQAGSFSQIKKMILMK